MKKIKKGINQEEGQLNLNLPDSELSADDLSTDEADADPGEVKSIQEFIEMKRRQNQILGKLLEKITKQEKKDNNQV